MRRSPDDPFSVAITMTVVLEVLSGLCLIAGGLLCIVGSLGLLRLPDFYTRMHAAGITDTLGSGLVIVGLALHEGLTLATGKLALVLAFLLFTSPSATHALARAARLGNLRPVLGAGREDPSASS